MFETTIEKFIVLSLTTISITSFLMYANMKKLYQQERKKNDL
ncbi:hypothetical protein [Oceanobacillus manasiensis]|nr:hypothetical protein [Oceanobacillus manasiensis]